MCHRCPAWLGFRYLRSHDQQGTFLQLLWFQRILKYLQCLLRNRIHHPRYENLITKLLNGERLPQESGIHELLENSRVAEISAPAEPAKLTVNQQHLKQAWDVSSVSTREDWTEWMHRLSVEFMKESPSHALRACMSLVEFHPPLAKDLFNAAFISCWTELYDQYQVGALAVQLRS